LIHQVYMHKQVRHTIRVLFNYSQPSTKSTNAHIHQSTYSIMTQLINYSNACNVLDSSRCMWYRVNTEVATSWCNKNIIIVANMDIKSVTINHVCMNIWLNNNAYLHTYSSTIIVSNVIHAITIFQLQLFACINSTRQQPTTYMSCYNSSA